jgi:predicted HTH transcriptional regulator
MKPKIDLKELATRESEQVEWKKNVADISDVLRTITAFANDFQNLGGGYVVCGAEETKDEHGFQKVTYPGLTASRFKEVEGTVIHDARDKIDPSITPLDTTIRPRNFSLILFGKESTKFFPGAWTKVSIYPGKDRSEPTGERHDLTGTVVSQARKALDLLRTHSSTAFDKESSEPNAPKYPERALQEAVINAIVHRDYEVDEPTNITVFADRMEIRSPGSLPRSVDKEKFLSGNASPSWRNQSLAYFFNKLQLEQAEGQGIPTIIRTMKQLGSPAPTFEIEEMAVTCVLPTHPRHEMMRHVTEIERLIVQQDLEEAQLRLMPLLMEQPATPKLLEMLAQLASLRQRLNPLVSMFWKHNSSRRIYQRAQFTNLPSY